MTPPPPPPPPPSPHAAGTGTGEPYAAPSQLEFDAMARLLRETSARLAAVVRQALPEDYLFMNVAPAPAGSLCDHPPDRWMGLIRQSLNEASIAYFLMEHALTGSTGEAGDAGADDAGADDAGEAGATGDREGPSCHS